MGGNSSDQISLSGFYAGPFLSSPPAFHSKLLNFTVQDAMWWLGSHLLMGWPLLSPVLAPPWVLHGFSTERSMGFGCWVSISVQVTVSCSYFHRERYRKSPSKVKAILTVAWKAHETLHVETDTGSLEPWPARPATTSNQDYGGSRYQRELLGYRVKEGVCEGIFTAFPFPPLDCPLTVKPPNLSV